MNAATLPGLFSLFCVGLLAGEEFTIRYGVRATISSLDDRPHIQLRQALIRRLRILVPTLFALTILSCIATTITGGFGPGFAFRCAGLLALVGFITVTLRGTVPINQAALTWDSAAPPRNWRALVERWEQLDTVRCWAALVAFALFLIATMLR